MNAQFLLADWESRAEGSPVQRHTWSKAGIITQGPAAQCALHPGTHADTHQAEAGPHPGFVKEESDRRPTDSPVWFLSVAPGSSMEV